MCLPPFSQHVLIGIIPNLINKSTNSFIQIANFYYRSADLINLSSLWRFSFFFYHDLIELNYIHDELNEKILFVRRTDPKKKKLKGLQTITKDRGKSLACKLDYLLDTIQHRISFTQTFNITS